MSSVETAINQLQKALTATDGETAQNTAPTQQGLENLFQYGRDEVYSFCGSDIREALASRRPDKLVNLLKKSDGSLSFLAQAFIGTQLTIEKGDNWQQKAGFDQLSTDVQLLGAMFAQ